MTQPDFRPTTSQAEYAARIEAKFGPFNAARWIRDMELAGYRLHAINEPDGTWALYTKEPNRHPPHDDDPAPLLNIGDREGQLKAVLDHLENHRG